MKNKTLNPTTKISILRMEIIKWKSQVEEYQEGIIYLTEHKNIIRRLEEEWEEERMTQRLQEEELQSNLRELKKVPVYAEGKRADVCTFSRTLGH